jgi:hypothetical protein
MRKATQLKFSRLGFLADLRFSFGGFFYGISGNAQEPKPVSIIFQAVAVR